MTEAIAPGYMALPFDWQRLGPERVSGVLDHFCAHPLWMVQALGPEEMRVAAAAVLTSPDNRIWEVWRGGEMCGLLLLTNIIPMVDAQVHFTFMDRNLIGKTRLIVNWMRDCVAMFDFQRLTAEVPEYEPRLRKFYRNKLGFRYEGEGSVKDRMTRWLGHMKPEAALEQMAVEFADLSSRRERSIRGRSGPDEWKDLIRLRVLRGELLD